MNNEENKRRELIWIAVGIVAILAIWLSSYLLYK